MPDSESVQHRSSTLGLAVLLALPACLGSSDKEQAKSPDSTPSTTTTTSAPCGPTRIATLATDGAVVDVQVSGDYAYIASDGDGLIIADISDPANPTVVGKLPMVFRIVRLALSGQHVVASLVDRGVAIVDVSNPANPHTVGSLDTPSDTFDLDVDGDIAVVAGMSGGLHIIDIADPTAPVELATVPPEGGWFRDAVIAGNLVYAAVGGRGLWVVDIANPAQPEVIGRWERPGWSYSVTASGSTVYLSDAVFGLRIIDVSQPTDPVELGSWYHGGGALEAQVVGDKVYTGTYWQSLQILDISDPTNPRPDAFYESGDSYGSVVVGSTAYVGLDWNGFQTVQLCEDSGQPPGDTIGTPGPRAPTCGDSVIDTGETCDDSDRTDGDGCSSDCQLEPGWGCDTEVEPTICSAAQWHLEVEVNALSAILSQDLSGELPGVPLRVASVDIGTLHTQGLEPAIIAENQHTPAACGAPGDPCDAQVLLGAITAASGPAGVLTADSFGSAVAPTVSQVMTADERAALNLTSDYYGTTPATAFTTAAVNALSVAVGTARGETWSTDELLCRGATVVWALDSLWSLDQVTVDPGTLPATLYYLSEAGGAGPDFSLGTADDDTVGLLGGTETDTNGAILVVPDAPCGSTSPQTELVTGTYAGNPTDPNWDFDLGWTPGVISVITADYGARP